MGIQDRDYYGDQYRKVSSLRPKGRGPSALKLAAFWVVVVIAGFLIAKRWWLPATPPTPPAMQRQQANSAVAAVTAAVPGPRPNVPSPVLPGSSPMPSSQAAAPIYRCGEHYGNSPCPGGRTIEGPAATGFDSRPSEKLARLVADGRNVSSTTTTTFSETTTNRTSSTSYACPGLAQEILAIDSAARRPLDAYAQDRLTARRRQVRDRQSALHCP